MNATNTNEALDQAIAYLEKKSDCFREDTPEYQAYQSAMSELRATYRRQSTIHDTKGYAIFCSTLCEGEIPVGCISEDGQPDRWQTFDTEREAQLEIVEDLEEHIRQFKDGDRDYDEIDMPPNCYTQLVTIHPDGSISTDTDTYPAP